MRQLFVFTNAATTIAVTVAAAALLLANTALAQDLNLFEPIDRAQEDQDQMRGPQPAQSQNGQPAFHLQGTSRFGDQFKTLLVNREGATVEVSWRPGERTAVPGFPGFALTGADARSVTLEHPGNDACVASDTLGVSCASATSAELRLSPAAPLAMNGNSPQAQQAINNNGRNGNGGPTNVIVTDSNGQQVFINPFSGEPEVAQPLSDEERQQRQARQRERAARLGAFEVQRIDEADVRPGMRVVRTPFGDREVPIRE